MNEFIIKGLAIVSYDFFNFLSKKKFCNQGTVHFVRPITHWSKFSLPCKNGGVVLKVRAASIEISGSPMEASLVNMIGRVERLI